MPDVQRMRALTENRYWSEHEAREALDLFERSGLDLAEFARRNALSYDRLKRWRRRLAAPKLLRVELRGPTQPPITTALIIVLTNGIRVEVPAAVSLDHLRAVLEVAREC